MMPDSPLNAHWLTEDDGKLAVARVRINEQRIGNKEFKPYQFREALLDPLTWAFAFYSLVTNIPNGGVTNFFGQLVCALSEPSTPCRSPSQVARSHQWIIDKIVCLLTKYRLDFQIVGFSFTAEQSLLLSAPSWAIAIITLTGLGYLGDRYHNRIIFGCVGVLIATFGMILIITFIKQRCTTGRTLLVTCCYSRLGGITVTHLNQYLWVAYTKKTTVAGSISTDLLRRKHHRT
ncbi:Allantoate permease [Exophiala dermatitidis]|nr:Allantoate permease [Exophiala dermatitidis]KAJ4530283.1 Allantoate permease [Exophiala dermatitidis]KAJ4552285.1 Allantoate permease [Exophiala dermatitidis]KAJ4561051.1 Allantoate permease [Exophiala dermatitidis]KAJ4611676.1 Allantoate permease [Exophiala dermatitidis]